MLKGAPKTQKQSAAESSATTLISTTKKVRVWYKAMGVGRSHLSSEALAGAFHAKALWPVVVLRSGLERQTPPRHYLPKHPKHPSSPTPKKYSLNKNSVLAVHTASR